VRWEVHLSPLAAEQLREITDRRISEALIKRARALAESPELQGKPLGDDLAGCRSVRAVGQRWRIVYRLEQERIIVLVLALGLRKGRDRADVYNRLKRLIKLGLIEE